MKKLILEKVNAKEYKPMTIEALEEKIPDLTHEEFILILNELEESGDLIITKKNKVLNLASLNYAKGVIEAHSKGFAFVKIRQGVEVFIPNKDLGSAINKDLVIIEVDEVKNGKNPEGRVVKILKRNTKYITGKGKKFKTKVIVESLDDKVFGKYYVPGAQLGNIYHIEIRDYASRDKLGYGEIIDEIVETEGIDTIVNEVLFKNNIRIEFKEAVINEAKALKNPDEEYVEGNRRNLKDLFMVTIDGEDAKDFDDAISLSKEGDIYHLGVHIADVAHYVKRGSQIDKEAFKRGTSIYIPGKVIPMLPFLLSNDLCSLKSGVMRYAQSCTMDIDSTGKVIKYEIFPSIINVSHRMNYSDVTKIIEESDLEVMKKYRDDKNFYSLSLELSQLLLKRRSKKGAITFDIPELKVVLDEENKVTSLAKRSRNKAESIIEEFMLKANETVAEHLYWMNLPCVYRVHEPPNLDDLKKLNDFLKNLGMMVKMDGDTVHPMEYQKVVNKLEGHPMKDMIFQLMLRSMSHARYDISPIGHFGLSTKYYCHFTSPIRRYPDLLVHRFLHGTYEKNSKKRDVSFFQNDGNIGAKQASEMELIAESTEREVVKIRVAEYMIDYIGEVYTAKISGMISKGMFVELDNLAEGFIPFATLKGFHTYVEKDRLVLDPKGNVRFKMGERIKVKLVSVTIPTGRLDFVHEVDSNDKNSRE